MKILLAKDAGYCFGVRDAVNLAYETADKNGDVFSDFPGSNNGVVNLSEDNNSGVDITSVSLSGSNVLTFTKWGNCLQSGTIILNDTRQIHIKNLTGHWEVINS